eukprot:gene112-6529_t
MATLVAVNMREYLTFARGAAESDVRGLHIALLGQMMSAAEGHKGLTDAVSGDRFSASINGAKAATGHRAAAMRLSWHLTAAEGVDQREWFAKCQHPHFSAGVCSGELLCGDLGCERLLVYSFVGDAAAWVHALERLATRWGAAVAANEPVKQDAETAFYFRLRGAAAMAKRSHAGQREQRLWEAVAQQSEQEADEWMYQLEQAKAADVWRDYNLAHKSSLEGDFLIAEERITAGRDLQGRADPQVRAALRDAYDELGQAVARRPHLP